jgi:RND family efflux transporter MFP subunit
MSEEHEIEQSIEEMEFTRKKAVHAVVSFALCLLVLALTVASVFVLIKLMPDAKKTVPDQLVPAVDVVVVHKADRPLEIMTQGVVESVRDVLLSVEVGGRVVRVSPNMLKGSVVTEGERLVEIEQDDYLAALKQAEANRAAVELQLTQEEARREQAIRDWKKLGRGEPSELVLRQPHIESAQALLESAREEVKRAERNIARTVITAPFPGMVRDESVEIGAVLNPGSMVARIYSTTELEVRLPLSLEDFGSLKRDEGGAVVGEVVLKGVIGVDTYTWPGQVVRTDGEIDRETLSATVIVKVGESGANPVYLRRPPVGLFVQAEIPGRVLPGIVEIPRMALRGNATVLVVGADNRMREKTVMIHSTLRKTVLVNDGLSDGDRVIVTRMSGVVENSEVEIVKRDGREVAPPEEPDAPRGTE